MREQKFYGQGIRYLCDNARHLVCLPYTTENLHRMAEDLGIKRCWFHKDHYDIPKRRIAEIVAKCEMVSSREIVEIIRDGGVNRSCGPERGH